MLPVECPSASQMVHRAQGKQMHVSCMHFANTVWDLPRKTYWGRVGINQDQEHEEEAVAVLLPVEILHAVQKLSAFCRVAPVPPWSGSDASSSIAQGQAYCQQQHRHLGDVLHEMLCCGSTGIGLFQGATHQGSNAAEACPHALPAMDLLFRRVMRSRGSAESSAMAVGACCISDSTACMHRAATLGTQKASWL